MKKGLGGCSHDDPAPANHEPDPLEKLLDLDILKSFEVYEDSSNVNCLFLVPEDKDEEQPTILQDICCSNKNDSKRRKIDKEEKEKAVRQLAPSPALCPHSTSAPVEERPTRSAAVRKEKAGAEQSLGLGRTGKLKAQLSSLQLQLPHLARLDSQKISQARLMEEAGQYIQQQLAGLEQGEQQLAAVRAEIEQLSQQIEKVQEGLPDLSPPSAQPRHSKVKHRLDKTLI